MAFPTPRSIKAIFPGIQHRFARTRFSRVLDRRAATRVLQRIIRDTDDAITVTWLGRQIWQYPLDAWLIQEVVSELKPDAIVETGTYRGGSAFFFASLCDLLDNGRVISIDIDPLETIPHSRITYIKGSSIDPEIVTRVREELTAVGASTILVVLDSLHTAAHVKAELEAYAPFVPVGSYIHVQDGGLDQLPIFRAAPPGPVVAVKDFLKGHPAFVRAVDIERRYLMTGHPFGWLKRTVQPNNNP